MGNIFSASEVVELGIEIEKNGKDFYEILSKNTENKKIKETFLFLANEEEKHIKVFKEILDKTDKYIPQGLEADNYYAYIRSLASEHIFTQKDKGKEIAQSIKNEKEAIQKGIDFEEDSIVFYQGIKRVVLDYEKNIIDELISQEENHLRKLIDLKSQIG